MDKEVKQDLKDVWDYQKLMNLDFRGTSREKLTDKFNLPEESRMGVYFGGSLITSKERNYTIVGVVLEKEYGDVDVEYAYSFEELIKTVNTFIEKYPDDRTLVLFGFEVHKLNAEGRMDICGEEDLERRRMIIKNGTVLEGKVEVG